MTNVLADEKHKTLKKDQDLQQKQQLIEENKSLITGLEGKISDFENSSKNMQLLAEASGKLELDLQESNSIIEQKNIKISELKTQLNALSCSKESILNQHDNFVKQKESLEKDLLFKDREIKELNEEIKEFEEEKLALKRKEIVLSNQHKGEVQSLSDDIENNRTNYVKKINSLEDQLACEHEERFKVLREKHQLENRVSELVNDSEKDEMINKLKSDLRKRGILLKDAQSLVDKLQQENSKKLMVKQL